jgi:hypothetical protein
MRKMPIPKHDLSRFNPTTPSAVAKVQEFLAAGAVITAVKRECVLLRRQESVATIDACGRVAWSAAPKSRRLSG